MNKLPHGAGGQTAARRQNPAGKSPLPSYPRVSAKELGQGGYLFVKRPKAGFLGSPRSRVPVGSGGTTAYFGGGRRFDPRLLAPGSDFVSLFAEPKAKGDSRIAPT